MTLCSSCWEACVHGDRYEGRILACATHRTVFLLLHIQHPLGSKRFLRMPFGISSASEVLQQRNDETFGDIADVHVIADDLIIAGKDDSEHDSAMLKVLDRARERM